ncbi:MAG TPA: two-component sensor histidine kinase [Candidatus Acetatifactor stercoripullorum]|uniref:histidine kinase n=1 Tax=Candidatus Acetatifactor stercoripullorum TaxID=2838414 RepID=A0A9D1UBN4_9FIRM|nr:ATP-binding protein [uncultured Acetatifactor sp.]HIW81929.1 two-component sensor histidine kinase [Candidatus Acetatifactor stercoripullorum]
MKKKINRKLVLIATLAIFFTMLLITVVYYDLFRGQVFEDLRAYTMILTEYEDMSQIREVSDKLEEYEMRVTLVGEDGKVLFDSEADSASMENHGERPEIVEAMETGEGQAVRNSETLSENTFYYAVRLENGSVLRIAKDAGSIYSIFGRALPSLFMVLLALIVLCMVLAHYLTSKLIAPIERLAENLDESNDGTDYEELTPFISMIKEQHEDIMKNARMRQEFTANVSHELKTPLTSISGYAELIETGMASEEDVVRFAHGIHSSANRLLTLINDIIRLSELDGTEEEVSFERLNLYQLADTCVEMLALNAEKHKVTIRLSGTECYITGNKQMIEELLYNLCDNAIRYNNEGGSVSVEVYPKHGQTVLTVKDTGIGIPKEHQERIFERFYRVDKSRSKSTGGTGLGLAIVKHIIAKHNAKMELASEVGKGTTITVIFMG